MSSIQSLLDSHLSEINRLSTIKTNEVDFKKLIKYTYLFILRLIKASTHQNQKIV